MKTPDPANLKASRKWIRDRFGVEGRYAVALRQVEKSLDAIASHEYDLLLAKAGLLSCLDRWDDLAEHFELLLRLYPKDLEVHTEIGNMFAAHGDWKTARLVLEGGRRASRRNSDPTVLQSYYVSWLSSIFVAYGKSRAIREGERILKRHPRFWMVRTDLRHIRNGTLRVEGWASPTAPYLKALRRLVTAGKQ